MAPLCDGSTLIVSASATLVGSLAPTASIVSDSRGSLSTTAPVFPATTGVPERSPLIASAAGGAVGGVAIVLLIAVVCALRVRSRATNNRDANPANNMDEVPSSASIYGPIASVAVEYNEPHDVRRNEQ